MTDPLAALTALICEHSGLTGPRAGRLADKIAAEWPAAGDVADVWPCDNYLAPHTCLTARSARGAECYFCTRQASAAEHGALERASYMLDSLRTPEAHKHAQMLRDRARAAVDGGEHD